MNDDYAPEAWRREEERKASEGENQDLLGRITSLEEEVRVHRRALNSLLESALELKAQKAQKELRENFDALLKKYRGGLGPQDEVDG
jgi:ElaB/YqjD/DUF883 family membrane-anchored ribosome-binding protein